MLPVKKNFGIPGAARLVRPALFVLGAALLPAAAGALPFWLHLPEQASTFAPRIDDMFHLIMWITGIIFVLVESILLLFLWKYRRRPGREVRYTHGNNRLEVIWTIIPATLMLGLCTYAYVELHNAEIESLLTRLTEQMEQDELSAGEDAGA